MIGFSIFSLLVSYFIFIAVSNLVYLMGPSNIFYANLLILLVGCAIVSLVFTMRQFRHYGRNKWQEPMFHNVLIRTFLINFVILFIISRLF